MKPFLKWAGGKQRLVKTLLSHVPSDYNKYIEPFIGAGSLYLALKPKKAIISDLNPDLISTYRGLQSNVEKVISTLQTFKNTKDDYVKIRDEDTEDLTWETQAARMIYINKCGFNGLYRVNKSGECNVAYGKRKDPNYDFDNIREVAHFMTNESNTTVLHGDYRAVIHDVEPNDFIYLDPPYYGTFAGYTSTPFTNADLQILADFVDMCVAKGAKVMISNANHEEVRKAFAKYTIIDVNLAWIIGGKADRRKKEGTEILIKTW